MLKTFLELNELNSICLKTVRWPSFRYTVAFLTPISKLFHKLNIIYFMVIQWLKSDTTFLAARNYLVRSKSFSVSLVLYVARVQLDYIESLRH